MEKKVKELILSGKTLNDIYHQLSTTKTVINNTLKNIDRITLTKCGWDAPRQKIEKALFSLHRKYNYFRNVKIGESDVCFDYVLFEDDEPKLAILYLGPEFLVSNKQPLYDKKTYSSAIESLDQKVAVCDKKHLPLLLFSVLELFDNPFLAGNMRDALKDCSHAEKHNQNTRNEYLDICLLDSCSYDNYHEVTGSLVCGCYNCGAVIKSDEIKSWDQGECAFCPICNSDSIITESQGFPINEEFMEKIKNLYQECE